MIIQVMIKYPHQLMLTYLHLFEWLCNMLFFHVCQQENYFEWKLCTRSCSMDRKEREPKLIQLANWIGRATSVIPGGQQAVDDVDTFGPIIFFPKYFTAFCFIIFDISNIFPKGWTCFSLLQTGKFAGVILLYPQSTTVNTSRRIQPSTPAWLA